MRETLDIMEDQQVRSKRPRTEDCQSLTQLLLESRWEEAIDRVAIHPSEAATLPDPSPLALACRSGAPYECVRVLLEAAPERLRRVLDSRGTPLHEAIVCEHTGIEVIDVLLKADEALGNETTRATLLQDVDGFTPLHLLIRRRFQSHILSSNDDSSLMKILERLVSSCPEAVVIPDRGEYEEPPIVYAIKANIYAPSIGSEDDTLARVERQIYEMVRIMLKHAPYAAAQVFSGFRGQYTALHSAVFHGRYTTTIDLLLRTEKEFPAAQKAALLTNTQAELPLHFW
jgi:Ankyrin repeats (3 copies)